MTKRLMLFLSVALLAASAHSQDAGAPAEAAAPAGDGFAVTDMMLLVSDEFNDTFNAEDLFANSLPSFAMSSTRPRAAIADRHQPMPLGVIRFDGQLPEQLDVLVNINEGKPFYGWPPQRMKKESRLLWQRLTIDQRAEALTDPKAEGHWINLLRAEGLPVVHANRKAEQALVYDIALRQENPLKVLRRGEGYAVERGDALPIRDVTLLKPAEDGTVRRVYLPADADGPAEPADQTHETMDDAVAAIGSGLEGLGLHPEQVDVAAAVIKRFAIAEKGELVAVYHVDGAWLDQRLPLEITPAADSVTRVGIVVLINADPDLLGQIDELIDDLGHAEWPRRQEAQARLLELGEVARPRLEKRRRHPDAEVSFRIEVLLEQFEADKSIDKP